MRVLIGNQSNASATIAQAMQSLPAISPAPAVQTQHVAVFAMPSLGQGGLQVAAGVGEVCEQDYIQLCTLFGIQVPHFDVTLAPLSQFMNGTGGAYHMTCNATDLVCDVQLNPTISPLVSAALIVAEATEVFEAVQNRGWDCGASNGEGLSRVLANESHPGVLEGIGYSSAAAWLDDGLRADWVNVTFQSDVNQSANGCAVLFLNWLRYQIGISWEQVCQAGGATLAETFTRAGGPALIGVANPFIPFRALLDNHFPTNQPSGLTTDNPFPLS